MEVRRYIFFNSPSIDNIKNLRIAPLIKLKTEQRIRNSGISIIVCDVKCLFIASSRRLIIRQAQLYTKEISLAPEYRYV